METKVTLYNAAGERIGDTFARRAKQLVKHQRAHWVDESETAVRFHPGMEHLKEIEEEAPRELPNDENLKRTEEHLLYLAKERVWFDNLMRMLVGIYVAVNVFVVGIWFFTGRGYFWPGWVIGGWGTALVVLNIIIKLIVVPPPNNQYRVDAEYRRLRNHAGLDD